MSQPNITIYGSLSCADTNRVRDLLEKEGLIFEFKDVDASPEYDGYIAEYSGGKRVLPVIRIDNETMVNPTDNLLKHTILEAEEALGFGLK